MGFTVGTLSTESMEQQSVLEVSYTVIEINKDQEKAQLLQTIATFINVQITIDKENEIPFIPSTNFQLAKSQDKLFCYGPGGSGKSRLIFELVKASLNEDVERIYILNPRQDIDKKVQRINVIHLTRQFTPCDIIIWDDFPDGLSKLDIATCKTVIDLLSSRETKNLFISLKPKFLEAYRGITDDIPEIYAYQVRYDISQLKEMLLLYGTKILEYKNLFDKYVSHNIINISRLLWQREPFPLIILNYYNELIDLENSNGKLIDALEVAQTMIYPSVYYEHQFEHLVNSKTRATDAEFLYIVKMCYDLAFDRKLRRIEFIQSRIFGSSPPKDLSKSLGSWTYLSGQYVSMHDVPRNAIKFTDQIKLRIIDYLVNDFQDIMSGDENQNVFVGVFFGRNIQLILQNDPSNNDQESFLPLHIYNYMKSHRQFEVAIGQGIGDIFYSLDISLQYRILDRLKNDGELARGLGESLGNSFAELDESIRIDLLSNRIHESLLFARGLGESLGNNFYKLPIWLQEEILRISLKEKNYNFPRGLGAGLGRKFRYLKEDVKRKLVSITTKNVALAIGIGYGLGLDFTSTSISKEFQNDIKKMARENGEVTRGLGMGFGQNYSFLDKKLQNEIIKWSEKDPRLEFGFAYQISFLFTSLTKDYQNFIFKKIEKNSEFAYGSGWGFGVVYAYLPEQIQHILIDLTTKKMRFAVGLGSGLGNHLQYLTKQMKNQFFSFIDTNSGFALGSGFGIGRSFTFLNPELQNKAWRLMQTNFLFAVGLGWGLGFVFPYSDKSLQKKILRSILKEPGLASGFGWGLGFMFDYLPKDLQQQSKLLMLNNNQFAFGLGIGHGSLFKYLNPVSQEKVWKMAEENVQFALGLGYEMGYLFNYLNIEIKQNILSKSKINFSISKGLGWGLGNILISVPKNKQQPILQIAQTNPQLLRGLGWGVGNNLSYLSTVLFQTILKTMNNSIQFAIGLGEGIGRVFQHLDNQEQLMTIQLFKKNIAIARGLGFGLGHTIGYLNSGSQENVWKMAEENVQFAIGMGEGIGEIFEFLPLSIQDDLFNRIEQHESLKCGFGSGLGNLIPFYEINKKIYEKTTYLIHKNDYFARGYGESIGESCNYWSKSILDSIIMPNIVQNNMFAVGLGEGVGHSMPYGIWKYIIDEIHGTIANTSLSKDRNGIFMVLKELFSYDSFVYGVGHGFSSIYGNMDEEDRSRILNVLMPKYQEFARGLGHGIGRAFPSLNQKLQDEILNLVTDTKNDEFARGLGHGIGFGFMYLEPIERRALVVFARESDEFARGLGHGIGRAFPSLNQKLQDEILNLVTDTKNDEFARELAEGLSYSIAYMDDQSQIKLLALIKKRDQSSINLPEHIENRNLTTDFVYINEAFSTPIVPNYNSSVIGQTHERMNQPFNIEEFLVDPEILFSGKRENYCICYIDMMNSTKISSTLDDIQLGKYYSTFLNSMATIAKNFGAKIIKNAGDCLIYYFPSTSNSNNPTAFRSVIECGITMISAHNAINAKLFGEKLPPLNYRISADYGKVEIARSSSSQSDDFFGSAMNVCAKINSNATPNGMVIGHKLYLMIASVKETDYNFEKIGEYLGFKDPYPIYSIRTRKNRNILNPFGRTMESV